MCVNNLWQVASARHLYKGSAEPGKAAQLCVFCLGYGYLYLGVLSMCLGMGVRYTYSSAETENVELQVCLEMNQFGCRGQHREVSVLNPMSNVLQASWNWWTTNYRATTLSPVTWPSTCSMSLTASTFLVSLFFRNFQQQPKSVI